MHQSVGYALVFLILVSLILIVVQSCSSIIKANSAESGKDGAASLPNAPLLRFDRYRKRPPADKATPSSQTLDYNGYHYKWFLQPYCYENAEKICNRLNGSLIYFEDKEEYLKIRDWTIRNLTDRNPLEELGSFFTGANRLYVSEGETPRPDDDPTSTMHNLKWNISGMQKKAWDGVAGNYTAWCEDRNRDLGKKEVGKGSIGWGSIIQAMADEERYKKEPSTRWRAASSVRPMLDLKMVMDFGSTTRPEDESMGCWKFEYGPTDAQKEANKKMDEFSRPFGLPFICKISI